MKKFVFVYYGGNKHKDMSDDERKAVMDKWMTWFGTFKDKQVDGGNPFMDNGQAVTADGVADIPTDMWPAKGYTIINAADINEACEVAKGCPMIVDGEPNATIRVYEAMPM